MAQSQKEALSARKSAAIAVIKGDMEKIRADFGLLDKALIAGDSQIYATANRIAGVAAELSRMAAVVSTLNDLEGRE